MAPTPGARTVHEVERGARGDVLEHDAQLQVPGRERRQHRLDEARLALEDVDLRVGHLAMHLQHHADLGHARQRRVDAAHVGDAGVGVRGRTGRIELAADDACGLGARDLLGRRGVGQVQRHERLERGAGRQPCADALAVLERLARRGHRRVQVRHDDGAREARGGERQHRGQRRTVAQVHVPVVGTPQHQGLHGAGPSAANTFCFSSSSRAKRTPKPVMSVLTWPSPPLRLAADRSTCAQGVVCGTKRDRKRVARM